VRSATWGGGISTRFSRCVWTTQVAAAPCRASFLRQMPSVPVLYRFAGALERLHGASRDAAALERVWEREALDRTAWRALALGRRAAGPALEPLLAAVDRRLLAVLECCRALVDPHVVTFRVPELERWQHAAAAALVAARWGVAGLRAVVADTGAPLARRYFAFLALAERHPEGAWPLFERYLETPGAHHAFVAAAVEAARYYPGHSAVLVRLFERIRGDDAAPRLFPLGIGRSGGVGVLSRLRRPRPDGDQRRRRRGRRGGWTPPAGRACGRARRRAARARPRAQVRGAAPGRARRVRGRL